MNEQIKLLKGDCLELMKDIPDKSIDAIIADPPYNISRETNFHTMGHNGTSMNFGEWDKNADIVSWINELPRILRDGANIIIFNCWKNLGHISDKLKSNGFIPKRCLVLNKSNPAPFNRDRLFVNDVEFAIWAVNGKNWTFNRQNSKYEKCVFDTSVQSKKYHPTMKDLDVIKRLIKILTNENDIVLDPFMGSGTTGIACLNTNRRFIGIEKDDKYFDIAYNRIKNHINNENIPLRKSEDLLI